MAQWHPHKTVATIVVRDAKFLMVEELIDGALVLNQPAGHLEPNETIAQAAIRETLEETAWEVELTAFLGLYQSNAVAKNTCYIRSCFIASPVQHFPERPLDTDIVRALWLSREEINVRKDQLRSPVVMRVIDDYLAGKHFPLDAVTFLD